MFDFISRTTPFILYVIRLPKICTHTTEVERLRQYVGPTVTSSVLAGFLMQYKTEDYSKRVGKAYETCMEEVRRVRL